MSDDIDGEKGLAEMPLQRHAELAHATIRSLPAALDTKATFFAGVLGAVLLFQHKAFASIIYQPPYDVETLIHFMPAYFYLSMTFLALVCCFVVVRPRSEGDKRLLLSYISFARRRSVDDALKDFMSYNDGLSKEAIIRHCFELSRLCQQKTWWLNCAFLLGGLALVMFVVLQGLGLSKIVPEFTSGLCAVC